MLSLETYTEAGEHALDVLDFTSERVGCAGGTYGRAERAMLHHAAGDGRRGLQQRRRSTTVQTFERCDFEAEQARDGLPAEERYEEFWGLREQGCALQEREREEQPPSDTEF